MPLKIIKKEKYQWAIYIKSLSKDNLKELIKALEGNIKLGIEVSRNEGYLEFAKKILRGEN